MDQVALIVALSTWLTPMPQHAQGLFVYYGSQRLIEANAAYHGYDLSPYRDRCGVSIISPDDLGRVVWLRIGNEWYGPCLGVDVASMRDFYNIVYRNGEVAELAEPQRSHFGFGSSAPSEIFVGECPPDSESQPLPYFPQLNFAPAGTIEPAMYPYPAQEWPGECQ